MDGIRGRSLWVWGSRRDAIADLELAADQQVEGLELEMIPLPQVIGHLVDAGGAMVSGWHVVMLDQGTRNKSTTQWRLHCGPPTSASGAFQLRDV